MRFDFVKPFVSSARDVLQQVLTDPVAAGAVALSPTPKAFGGVTAIVGVTGEGEGRVLFQMTSSTALAIADSVG